jgi:hypothetical protein
MIPHIPEKFSTSLIDWSPIMGNTMPPRDPDEDEGDEDRANEPPVVRKPDEELELNSEGAAEKSKNQLSRDFPGCSIFDFCNSICRKLTSSRLPPAPNPIAGFPAQQTSTSAFEEAFWIFLTLLKY